MRAEGAGENGRTEGVRTHLTDLSLHRGRRGRQQASPQGSGRHRNPPRPVCAMRPPVSLFSATWQSASRAVDASRDTAKLAQRKKKQSNEHHMAFPKGGDSQPNQAIHVVRCALVSTPSPSSEERRMRINRTCRRAGADGATPNQQKRCGRCSGVCAMWGWREGAATAWAKGMSPEGWLGRWEDLSSASGGCKTEQPVERECQTRETQPLTSQVRQLTIIDGVNVMTSQVCASFHTARHGLDSQAHHSDGCAGLTTDQGSSGMHRDESRGKKDGAMRVPTESPLPPYSAQPRRRRRPNRPRPPPPAAAHWLPRPSVSVPVSRHRAAPLGHGAGRRMGGGGWGESAVSSPDLGGGRCCERGAPIGVTLA